jgi:hypothetical protein
MGPIAALRTNAVRRFGNGFALTLRSGKDLCSMPPWRLGLVAGLLWQLSCYPDTGKYRIEGGAGGAGTDASAGVDGNAGDGRTGGAIGTGGTKAGGAGGVVVGAGGAGGAGGGLGQGGASATGGASAMGGSTGGTAAGGATGGMAGMAGAGGAGGTDTTAHDKFVGTWTVAGSNVLDCMGTQSMYSLQAAPMIVTTAGGDDVALILEDCTLVMQVGGNTAILTSEQQCNDVPPFAGDYLYKTGTFTVTGTTANLTRTGLASLMPTPFTPGGHCTFSENFTATRDPP